MFLTLDRLDMRDYYDPSNRTYKAVIKDHMGKELLNRTFSGYNKREISVRLDEILMSDRRIRTVEPIDINIINHLMIDTPTVKTGGILGLPL